MTAPDSNGGASDNSVPLTTEDALTAISNSRRRFVIRFLDEGETPTDASEVAEHLAAVETTGPTDAQDRKNIYIALTQQHLDTLAELDAIAYHERSKMLMPSHATHALADLIRHIEHLCEGGLSR
jgi:hypothetical protein